MRPVAVVGLGFGDEGKGAIVDAIAGSRLRKNTAQVVVRFNGGAQAGHHVMLPGKMTTHCFSQWGAGTFAGAKTHLSRHMLLDPLAMFNEAEELASVGVSNPLELVTVDPEAVVITPYHAALNQAKERARGDARHGSCGRGIGEVVFDANRRPGEVIRAKHLGQGIDYALRLLNMTRDRLMHEFVVLGTPVPDLSYDVYERFGKLKLKLMPDRDLLRMAHHLGVHVIFEGAQGILLDEDYGFHPHTTWSACTFKNADDLCADAGIERPYHLGVTRTFHTRHGAGPLPTFREGYLADVRDDNEEDPWQGRFRRGWFDQTLFRYALHASGGVDGLAVNHLDVVQSGVVIAKPYNAPFPTGQASTFAREGLTAALSRVEVEAEVALYDEEKFRDFITERTGIEVVIDGFRPERHMKSGAIGDLEVG